jgi:hypothetical protein
MAVRAMVSASARAIAHAGEVRVAEAVRPHGSVGWLNRFRGCGEAYRRAYSSSALLILERPGMCRALARS